MSSTITLTAGADEPIPPGTRPVLKDLLAQLRGVHQHEDSRVWDALCPMHDDRQPSLTVSVADDGRAVPFCHVCTPTDTVGAGTWSSSFRSALTGASESSRKYRLEPKEADHGLDLTTLREHTFTDAAGDPVAKHILYKRTIPGIGTGSEVWRWRRAVRDGERGGWRYEFGLDGVSVPLYGLPDLLQHIESRARVFVTEDEQAADMLTDLGLVATTNPGTVLPTTPAWAPGHLDALSEACVSIVASNSSSGITWARALSADLAHAGGEVVSVLMPTVKNDAVPDHARRYGSLTEVVRALIPVGVEAVRRLSSTDTLSITWASDVRAEPVEWLWKGWWSTGVFTLLAGREGGGKSSLQAHLAAQLSRGTLAGDFLGSPQRVLIVGTEDSINSVWVPRLTAECADLTRIAFEPRLKTVDSSTGKEVLDLLDLSSPANLDRLLQLLHKLEITVVIFDHLSAALPGRSDSNSYSDMGGALRRLNQWAQHGNIAALGGWHSRKSGGAMADATIGSVGIRASARALWVLVQDPDTGSRVLALDKSNIGSTGVPANAFEISPTRVTSEGTTIETSHITDFHELQHQGSGRDYAQGLLDRGQSKARAEAQPGDTFSVMEWLAQFLMDGAIKRAVVLATAAEMGVSESSVERAAASLNVRRERIGKDALWSMP